MPLTIETFVLGPLMTNCYVLREGRDCWVVDPSMWPEKIIRHLQRQGVSPTRIVLTHGHGDHIAGVPELKAAFPQAKVTCPAGDAPMLTSADLNLTSELGFPIELEAADELVEPGGTLRLGESDWHVLDTSGHTVGGVSYYCQQEQVVIAGDALFAGSIGRCDLPGGDEDRLLANIRTNLLSLPEPTRVLCGHGEETTIGQEAQTNPFLR